jgi:4-hydroxybenzoate polyprenyltransferase/phosphoserine phosphatase
MKDLSPAESFVAAPLPRALYSARLDSPSRTPATAAAAISGDEGGKIPLCVDLDGTLIKTDTFVESFLSLLKSRPFALLRVPFWLLSGRARLKREIAARTTLNVVSLPYNAELLAFLRDEQASGRPLFLVSAADRSIVEAVAEYVGLFQEVIASEGSVNLKGARKMEALRARFGVRGYDYAGNEVADLPVWREANAAIVVNAPPRLAKRTTTPIARTFAPSGNRFASLLRALRVQQWVKNLLVFVPVVMAHEVRDRGLMLAALVAFVSFSLCASAVYLTNDLLDLDADRRHASKCFRPFAAGDLNPLVGLMLAPLLLAASVLLALTLPLSFLATLAIYVVLTTLYSFSLKHIALVDVVILASLYTGRMMAGSAATGVWPSPWLLGFAMFFFLSLAFVKRYSELYAHRDAKESLRVRGYYPSDLEQIASLGAASGYISVLVAALYINTERVAALYREPALVWLVCPLLLYWISRVWLLAHRGEMHDDPVVFAVRDRVSYVVGALMAAVLVLAARGWR